MRRKSYTVTLAIVVATLMGVLVNNPSLVPSVNAQGAGDAYFTAVTYSIKIYEWTEDKWNFTVYNANCAVDIWGRAWFFFKFYLDGSLWWNEYTDTTYKTWQLNKGSSTTCTYTVSLGSGPDVKDVKIELYWDYEGTPYLQDTTYFSETIVKLFVSNWYPSSLFVEKGKITASTWSISFKNDGNDLMYSTSISIVDSSGLQISPMSVNLGDIASQGTKSTSFSVVAPGILSTGSKTVAFQISYNDFRGTSHVESETAYVTVTKLGTSITLTLQPSSVKKDSSTTITAKLLDGNANPIPNQPINFSIGTTNLGSANTDSSGNAIESYTANIDAGTHVVSASYGGSIDYGSSSAISNLIVNPFTTTLTIDVPSAVQGKPVTLKATLKDENGNPLQGMNIEFQLYDGTIWSAIGSSNTDSNGIASLSYTPLSTGTFQVRAVFSGTTNYSQSASTTGSLNAGIDYTPYYIGGGIIAVAIIGVAGYMVFRRRKKVAVPSQK